MNMSRIVLKNLVRTSQKTQSLSIIKPSHFRYFMEMKDIQFQTHTKHIGLYTED